MNVSVVIKTIGCYIVFFPVLLVCKVFYELGQAAEHLCYFIQGICTKFIKGE